MSIVRKRLKTTWRTQGPSPLPLSSLDKHRVVRTIPPNMSEETKPSKIVRPVPSLDDVTRDWLKTKLKAIEDITKKDVLTICGYIVPAVDVSVRMAIEGLREKKETLLIILDTPGGIVEEVRNIVQVMRHHYEYVHFLVPVYAMSAGTVLVMSGDKFIWIISLDWALLTLRSKLTAESAWFRLFPTCVNLKD